MDDNFQNVISDSVIWIAVYKQSFAIKKDSQSATHSTYTYSLWSSVFSLKFPMYNRSLKHSKDVVCTLLMSQRPPAFTGSYVKEFLLI